MSKETFQKIPAAASVIYLDVGNSSIKSAAYGRGEWQVLGRFAHDEIPELTELIQINYKCSDLIVISSVVKKISVQIAESFDNKRCLVLEMNNIPSELLDYETPDTLGIDRFLGCYGAVSLHGKPVVVIDAGTACTMDYMAENAVFHGGVILPGISALEQALEWNAPALPRVSRTTPVRWPGKSTETSLQWGITATFLDGIRAGLRRYEDVFGSFKLVLTGGDAKWLSTLLKWEHSVEPLLVFEGMRRFVADYEY